MGPEHRVAEEGIGAGPVHGPSLPKAKGWVKSCDFRVTDNQLHGASRSLPAQPCSSRAQVPETTAVAHPSALPIVFSFTVTELLT
jgi:hypothetical protein